MDDATGTDHYTVTNVNLYPSVHSVGKQAFYKYGSHAEQTGGTKVTVVGPRNEKLDVSEAGFVFFEGEYAPI